MLHKGGIISIIVAASIIFFALLYTLAIFLVKRGSKQSDVLQEDKSGLIEAGNGNFEFFFEESPFLVPDNMKQLLIQCVQSHYPCLVDIQLVSCTGTTITYTYGQSDGTRSSKKLFILNERDSVATNIVSHLVCQTIKILTNEVKYFYPNLSNIKIVSLSDDVITFTYKLPSGISSEPMQLKKECYDLNNDQTSLLTQYIQEKNPQLTRIEVLYYQPVSQSVAYIDKSSDENNILEMLFPLPETVKCVTTFKKFMRNLQHDKDKKEEEMVLTETQNNKSIIGGPIPAINKIHTPQSETTAEGCVQFL